MVERLTAFGISQPAICAELVRDGVPCRSLTTLARRFGAELAMGRERMINTLGHKVLDIALSDRPNNLNAALALLRMLDPRWREPKEPAADAENPAAPNPGIAMIYPREDMERAMPPEVVIEGNLAEVVPDEVPAAEPSETSDLTEAEETPAEEAQPRERIRI
jgi:hypothetical protein